MLTQRLGDLLADGVHRIERRHRVLQDHRELAAAVLAHLRLAQRAAGPRRRTRSCRSTILPPGGISRSSDRLVIVLPDPDSPTMPSVSPGRDREAHAVDGFDHPSPREEVRAQVLHLAAVGGGYVPSPPSRSASARGSSRSRSQSPRKLPDRTTRPIARPGKNEIHHAVSIRLRPSATIDPQLGNGRRDAGAQVAERRFDQDDRAQEQRGQDQQRVDDVRERCASA